MHSLLRPHATRHRTHRTLRIIRDTCCSTHKFCIVLKHRVHSHPCHVVPFICTTTSTTQRVHPQLLQSVSDTCAHGHHNETTYKNHTHDNKRCPHTHDINYMTPYMDVFICFDVVYIMQLILRTQLWCETNYFSFVVR